MTENETTLPGSSGRSRTKMVLLALLPLDVFSFSLTLRFPDRTDMLYSQSIYPLVAPSVRVS